MSMSAPSQPPPFQVVDQVHEEIPSPGGHMEGEWRIDFQTPSGIHSFIRVPDAMYNAAYIHSQIAAKVQEIEAVQAGPQGNA